MFVFLKFSFIALDGVFVYCGSCAVQFERREDLRDVTVVATWRRVVCFEFDPLVREDYFYRLGFVYLVGKMSHGVFQGLPILRCIVVAIFIINRGEILVLALRTRLSFRMVRFLPRSSW